MEPWEKHERWSFAQRKAVADELEAHLAEVLKEAGQLNLAAREKIILAKELLDRFGRHHDRDYGHDEELPF